MKVLVVNCGSSSLKYQLLEMGTESVLAKGLCERIGLGESFLKHSKVGSPAIVIQKDLPNHTSAILEVLHILTDAYAGVISSMDEISAVGHRIVHGAETFKDPVLIDDEVLAVLQKCASIAPLHNPPNITGIHACRELMPNKPMIGVFDTSFHSTMPPHAYIYPIPYEYYQKYSLRKYGFHGTSHKYVSERAAFLLNRPISELMLVTCHLGNGSSICAVKNGKSIDTSMGFTPLEGLPMGTRSGSLDPALVEFLSEKENMSAKEVLNLLNKKSGLLGVSGISSDFRDIEQAAKEGNERSLLALTIFKYRVKKYIGEYAAAMGGLDAVVFTGGIGENSSALRKEIATDLSGFGYEIDDEKNSHRGVEIDISTPSSKVRLLVIPTNEELSIAREVKRLLR